MITNRALRNSLGGIDDGLDYSRTSSDAECDANTTFYCYNEKRVDTYSDRADDSTPLTGEAAKLALVQFYSFVSAHQSISHANAMIAFFDFLAPYLGKTDACLVSQYLGQGKKFSDKPYAERLANIGNYGYPEVNCGTVDPNHLHTNLWDVDADRTVSEALQHAYLVFKNVSPVTSFIQHTGDLKRARALIPESMRTREQRTEVVDALKKSLESAVNVLAYLPYLLGGVFAVWFFMQLKAREREEKPSDI